MDHREHTVGLQLPPGTARRSLSVGALIILFAPFLTASCSSEVTEVTEVTTVSGALDTGPAVGAVGCFRDSGNRDLPHLAYDKGSNTAASCISACKSAGYAYAGTQYGAQCFCGNSYGGQGTANNCDTACTGDGSQKCGGAWANSVYSTGSGLGCFRDSGNRDLPYLASQSGSNTAASCISSCKSAGYAYAGTQDGSQCFCGNSYGGQGTANNCDMACSGGGDEKCGGAWANSVYGTGGTSPSPSPSPSPSSGGNSVQTIIDDMYLDGDAALHGTEGLDWGSGNPCKCSTAVPAKNWKGQFWGAMTSWGQAYIARSGSPATNVRVQIRNLKAWQLYNDGSWHLVQSSGSPEGAAFVEDFKNNGATGPDTRDESNNGGGISVTVGVKGFAGYNYHFWPSGGRAGVDGNVIHGVFTTAEARLIVDDPNKPDDRVSARTIIQMGADWWLDQNVGWLPDWSANSGINGGRSKWVTSQWRSYNMTTLPINELKANPPPL